MNEPDFIIEEWERDVSSRVARPLRFEVLAQMVASLSALVHGCGRALTMIGCARLHNLWAWDEPELGLDVLQIHTYPDTRHPGRDLDPIVTPARALGFSKPVLIGEFPGNPAEQHPPKRVAGRAADRRGAGSRAAGRLRWRVALELQRHGWLRAPSDPAAAGVRRATSGSGEPAQSQPVSRVEGPVPSERMSGRRVDGPSLHALVAAVALDANRTVGGGLVSIELLRRRFTARGWLDAVSHGVFIAVSRFTPGTVVLAYCVMLGWRFHRWRGALLALAVASVPASLIVFALAATLARIDRYAAVRALLAVGILAAERVGAGERMAPASTVSAGAVAGSTARGRCGCRRARRSRSHARSRAVGCSGGEQSAADRNGDVRFTRSGRQRMNAVLIYLLLLKATMTSFAGMGSLPQIRQDFVETRAAISDQQLSQAVLVGRATIGPMGAYVVAVGYYAGGWPGAIAGWLAMITPALIAIPLLILIQRWVHLPRIRAAVDGVIIASAVLLIVSGGTLAIDAVQQLIRLRA